ncbi:hypothetical protein BOS5A_10340 [Bosea sp. EC-HK365B]|nr:hypothetical protein BOSE46_10513 [Bosea sp. 46]CAD5250555.1 hypothetical protein BOSE21B_10730 [Bosea sp. 21B]VVT44067.1 hypothetical protein BOS5A_10340 [Bosea sp. EC-HK365B]VXC35593.1 hypothetical protein BOSE125_20192 [Bosea sp. 125]VXC41021.1 hypothetical protein BOSE127_190031 [Bosea sp. 127]
MADTAQDHPENTSNALRYRGLSIRSLNDVLRRAMKPAGGRPIEERARSLLRAKQRLNPVGGSHMANESLTGASFEYGQPVPARARCTRRTPAAEFLGAAASGRLCRCAARGALRRGRAGGFCLHGGAARGDFGAARRGRCGLEWLGR